MNIHEAIRTARILKGYSQEYMAIELDMTQAGYCRLENANNDLLFSRLLSIIKILGFKTLLTFLLWHEEQKKLSAKI